MNRTTRRDAGFTLPEMLISIILMAMIGSVVAMAIITSIRTAPDVSDRADSAIAVQGITTFLPPDVDSTEPGRFDTNPSTPSGCAGSDPGQNILHMRWTETFAGVTTNFVANYRFVIDGSTGTIVRLTCSGVLTLSSPEVLSMSAKLSNTVPTVNLFDTDGDGDDDQLTMQITTFSGDVVEIDAATKNPAETLPPVVTSGTTTTTTLPNQAPVAGPIGQFTPPATPITFMLPASDPDGDPLTVSFDSVPSGWTVTNVGLQVTVTPDPADTSGIFTFGYEVEDPGGLEATSTIQITISSAPTTTAAPTTTTTTTTTLPPCIVSSVTATPNPVQLKSNSPSKLKNTVTVTATVTGGYCVGLTLQYDTGGPNGQYVQNLGSSAPYRVDLIGHPHGTELWTAGNKVLEVRDGFDNLLASTTLVVNP